MNEAVGLTHRAGSGSFEGTLLLAGAGQMGGALLEAWLAMGLDPRSLTVLDPHPSARLTARLDRYGIALNPAAGSLAAPDVFFLAIKPQGLVSAAAALLPYISTETLLVSVMAGKTIAQLRAALPRAGTIARAIPNTPAAIRKGVTGVAAESGISDPHRRAIQFLLEAAGEVEWLADEALIDAVTAVSGSGPAYVFFLSECLAKAGEAAGLDPDAAMRLARATIQGAGALMAARPEQTPDLLRRNVTSPGGTTAAALEVLTRDTGLLSLMTEAVLAAKQRAGELSG